jgi:hypothetical protein
MNERERNAPGVADEDLVGLMPWYREIDTGRTQARPLEPHYSLGEAASRFFPGGKITGRSLRTEIGKGFLPRKEIACKLVTCASDIAKMLERKQCREERKVRVCTSGRRTALVGPSGSSKMERRALARAAALTT